MNWIYWVIIATSVGIAYQTAIKLSSNKLPMWSYLFVAGAGLVLLAFVLAGREDAAQRWAWVSSHNFTLLLAAGLSLVLLEVSIFSMYHSGAPVALARAIVAPVGMLGMLLIGVLVFKESLTLYQLSGIAMTIGGVMLMTLRIGHE